MHQKIAQLLEKRKKKKDDEMMFWLSNWILDRVADLFLLGIRAFLWLCAFFIVLGLVLSFSDFYAWASAVYISKKWSQPAENEMIFPTIVIGGGTFLYVGFTVCGWLVRAAAASSAAVAASLASSYPARETVRLLPPTSPPRPRDALSTEILAIARLIEVGTAERRSAESRLIERLDTLVDVFDSSAGGGVRRRHRPRARSQESDHDHDDHDHDDHEEEDGEDE